MRTSAELLKAHLSLVGRDATPDDLEIYAEDLVVEFPYAPDDHTHRLDGRAQIARFMGAIGEFAENIRLGEPVIHETQDGFIAEYRGESIFKATRSPYSQDYISVFKVSNGQIVSIREYYNPLRVLRALGEM